MNEIKNLNSLIDLSEKVSDSIKINKEKQWIAIISFLLLFITIGVFGYIHQFFNFSCFFEFLLCCAIICFSWKLSTNFSENKSSLKIDRMILKKLFDLTHEYKTITFSKSDISIIEKEIIEMKLSRISYSL